MPEPSSADASMTTEPAAAASMGGEKSGSTKTQPPKYCTKRWTLAYLLCVVRICQTTLRQCIGMALVCMTSIDVTNDNDVIQLQPTSRHNHTYSLVESSNSTLPNTARGEFSWTSAFEGHVLVAYYYGFLLTIVTAGYLDRLWGSVRTIAVGLVGGGAVNLLTPVLTRQHPYLLVALRVLAGAFNGLMDPPIFTLWSKWAPASERGQLTAVEYAGIGVGGILTFLISSLLCALPVDGGWPFLFYFYGAVSVVFGALWLWLARDSPEADPHISACELDFITSHRSELSLVKRVHPPWSTMLRSGPVWGILVAHASFSWVYSWVLAYLPMYMKEALHYDMAQNGRFSSLPFVGKLLLGLVGGYVSDLLIRTRLSVGTVRKTFQMAGSVGCAVPLLVISFLSHEERGLAVALLVISVSLQNLSSLAFRINSLDIAPRYAGFLMGTTSTIAVALTLTAPYVTSALLVNKSREDWQMVLYIVAGVSVTGGVVFLLLARGDVQPWARDSDLCIQVEAADPYDDHDTPAAAHAGNPDERDDTSDHKLPIVPGNEGGDFTRRLIGEKDSSQLTERNRIGESDL